MKKYLLPILLAFLYCCGVGAISEEKPHAQEIPQKNEIAIKTPTSGVYPIEATSKHEYPREEDTLQASIAGYNYYFYTDGRIKEENTNAGTVKNFKVLNESIVERAYLHHLNGNLLVFYTDTDSEMAGSKVELLNRETGEVIYSNDIWGFNLGQPIIFGMKSYVTAIGFVGKLDLRTGKYDWKHHDLYDHQKDSFNSFDSVDVGESMVEFISLHHRNKTEDKVIVDDKTGKIIRIVK